ncbi:MAG: hypothetical protein D6785_03595 [Planctomycetota bacterium]|nr:MAG: hypothetical protein D6785_03595 [Planctomycetota bacterium]
MREKRKDQTKRLMQSLVLWILGGVYFFISPLWGQSELMFQFSPNGEIYEVLHKGKGKIRLTIVLMSEGFCAKKIEKFKKDSKTISDKILSAPIFAPYRDRIAIYRVNVVSMDSGIDKSRHENTADTAFGVYYWKERNNILCRYPKRIQYVLSRIPGKGKKIGLVVTNFAEFCGISLGNDGILVPCHNLKGEISIHEMGHAVFCLGDEYGGNGRKWPGDEPFHANLSAEGNPKKVKWSRIIPSAVEGGLRYNYGIWHAEQFCRMKNSLMPACSVCRKEIQYYFGPLPSAAPELTFLSPSNGKEFKAGEKVVIRWKTAHLQKGGYVTLSYRRDVKIPPSKETIYRYKPKWIPLKRSPSGEKAREDQKVWTFPKIKSDHTDLYLHYRDKKGQLLATAMISLQRKKEILLSFLDLPRGTVFYQGGFKLINWKEENVPSYGKIVLSFQEGEKEEVLYKGNPAKRRVVKSKITHWGINNYGWYIPSRKVKYGRLVLYCYDGKKVLAQTRVAVGIGSFEEPPRERMAKKGKKRPAAAGLGFLRKLRKMRKEK